MDCSYCQKPRKLVFVLQEDVPGDGPAKKLACFDCLEGIAKKQMQDLRPAPDVIAIDTRNAQGNPHISGPGRNSM